MISLSPATIGEETPAGAATFHFRFFSGPNSTGGFCPSATPEPLGPRNCGQTGAVSPPSPTDVKNPAAANVIHTFMAVSSEVAVAVPDLERTYTIAFYA